MSANRDEKANTGQGSFEGLMLAWLMPGAAADSGWQRLRDTRAHENLQAHFREIEKRWPDLRVASEPSVELLDAFKAWALGASRVEPGTEAATMWQALFATVVKGDRAADVLIDTARQLQPQHLRLLARFAGGVLPPRLPLDDEDRFALQQLMDLRLVETAYLTRAAGLHLLLWAFLLATLLWRLGLPSAPFAYPWDRIGQVCGRVGIGLSFLIARPPFEKRLTWLGKKLSDHATPPPEV